MKNLIAAALIGATGLASAGALAQAFPSKPLRLVIPFAAGGGNDIVARVIAARMGQGFNQAMIVENRPGANGFIAPRAVADAPPDGYTILMGPTGPMSISPAIFSKMPYSPISDFTPVTMIGSFPLILVVSGGLPVKTVADLIAMAKANPTKMNYGSTAATFQLTSELFNLRSGTTFAHIPYKSSADFNTAVVTGEITIAFTDPPPAIGMLKSGKIRGLAVTANKRHSFWPDIPTMAEAGIKDMEVTIWMGLFLPANAPANIVSRIRDELVKGMAEPDIREKLIGLGVEPDGRPSTEFAKFHQADIARWTAIAKAANIKAD
ncbi:MAG: tripartite tricarboxylate transporter substrate binding protein [Betaproteobacteria bacterium]|nr:tripartite tricarboxylate transporter substrate binding protein [Betaproteobacteria bacterium]